MPLMAFGEYWDTCEYTDGVLNYNQDSHRQRTVSWCDQTGGTAAAFDFTLKGGFAALSCTSHACHATFRFCPSESLILCRMDSNLHADGKCRLCVRAGILQEAMGRGEYWRLCDSQGRPPGVLGMWPSRAVTFIDNHDTGVLANHFLYWQSRCRVCWMSSDSLLPVGL